VSSVLCPQVVEIDKFSPESWCVVGNSFSLRREHETAVKFFERALQLDRSFAYAHTLCGHEYVCNEDLEKAIQSFREAIFHDDRHYNAWYGLGKSLLLFSFPVLV
jgi:anaphase-promoting complex subunit 3